VSLRQWGNYGTYVRWGGCAAVVTKVVFNGRGCVAGENE